MKRRKIDFYSNIHVGVMSMTEGLWGWGLWGRYRKASPQRPEGDRDTTNADSWEVFPAKGGVTTMFRSGRWGGMGGMEGGTVGDQEQG